MATISLGFSSSVFKNHQLQQQQQQQAVCTKSPTLGPAHPNPNLRRTRISCAAAKREPRGITKPRPISIEMQELLGVAEIPRTQALKQIWAYIKQHNLQDPENKKIIVCDEKLKKIFAGKDRVGFLEVSGNRSHAHQLQWHRCGIWFWCWMWFWNWMGFWRHASAHIGSRYRGRLWSGIRPWMGLWYCLWQSLSDC